MNAIALLLRNLGALHFLRPWWFAAMLALPLLMAWWRVRQRRRSAWQGLVDPHLLPHLLDVQGRRRGRFGLWIAACSYLLAVLALAGPSWRQTAQPLWQSRTPLVIALDLSSASLAGDLPPSRLAQARAKLATLLRERNGGQVGLVAFAGDAFTVAPLTDDAANVAIFLDALQPDVMPVDGQRADRAIAGSAQLLKRANANSGDILVLTDHADSRANTAARDAATAGYRVSVLGVGSANGAAFRRGDGAILTARLDAASLRRLAASGNGRYTDLAGDDADLRALGLLDPRSAASAGSGESGRVWQDEGYWLLPPLMLLALFAFRRHAGAGMALMLLLVLPLAPAHAAGFWRRADQIQHAQLQQGNEAYRRGDFTHAAQQYEGIDTATAHYNRGNALAKAGQYPQAIEEYEQALRTAPRMDDARANKQTVEAAMKRQKQQKSGSKQGQSSQGGQNGQGNSPQAQQRPSAAPQNAQSSQAQNATQQRQPSPAQQPPATQASAQPDAHPGDKQAQQQADRAQRERMQRALQQARLQADQQATHGKRSEETPEQRERRLANEAWLKRVPDDPGGLLRTKFRLEYQRRTLQGRSDE